MNDKDWHDEWNNEAQNGNHLLTGDCREKENQEESNINSKRGGTNNTNHLSELESNAMHMTQDMQMMNALRGQVSTNLNELVQQIDSPFTAQVTSFPLPTKFSMPQVETYDGSRDLLNHLESFETLMHLQGVSDEIMCRAFPTTLKGLVRVWFNKLAPNTIYTFKELSGHFVTHFIGGQRYKRSLVSLLNIKQQDDESLRSYMTRFNKETLLIDEADNGLQSGEFLFSIYKNDLKMMANMLYQSSKYKYAEDAMIS